MPRQTRHAGRMLPPPGRYLGHYCFIGASPKRPWSLCPCRVGRVYRQLYYWDQPPGDPGLLGVASHTVVPEPLSPAGYQRESLANLDELAVGPHVLDSNSRRFAGRDAPSGAAPGSYPKIRYLKLMPPGRPDPDGPGIPVPVADRRLNLCESSHVKELVSTYLLQLKRLRMGNSGSLSHG
jgi:hypothetical protein